MTTTEVDIGVNYAIIGSNLAIPMREYTDADGATWIEAEFARAADDVIETYSKADFLKMILQKMTAGPTHNFEKE